MVVSWIRFAIKVEFLYNNSIAVKDVLFLFNGQLYCQINGIGMGNPLGPTMANIFLCHHEKNWINNCPNDFRPVFYRRYIDDTFILFNHPSHVSKFLNYINVQQPDIKFTSEIESNGKINFLDIVISKCDDNFTTSVYRKDTFTGLGMRFDSFIPNSFKSNVISCLIIRAFRICSTELLFSQELEFLKSFFQSNKFPFHFINKFFKKTISNI